ncbi:DUF3592 domain-containing protein [Streptomyces chitinivorans]|uniref:DUF3592 domain-containing protein n=1 Tax=Streptomyces chitinivorans TaxID=1257027 RepID=A0ABW7HQP6_9ACTN|nr:DUF3592 domain-containing protein [Streptomyces chitinivorans]MDH2407947.1 hypothetical protein [Streptomyces chitinivorans]
MFSSVLKRLVAALAGAVLLVLGGALVPITVLLVMDVGKGEDRDFDGRADAVVSGVTLTGGSPGMRGKVVRVSYEVEEERYSARLRGGVTGRALRVGDSVEVVYRAEDPGRPYSKDYAEQGPPGIGTGIVVAFCAAAMSTVALGASWFLLSFGAGRRKTVLGP